MSRQMTTPPGGHAGVYDALMWPVERLAVAEWRRRLSAQASGRVLEVGVGTGSQLRWYRPDVVVTALEPSAAMAARARRRAASARAPVVVVDGAAEELPFGAASFETVVFTFAFCSVADPERALAEVKRVLVPGGRLLMIEHVHLPWQPARWAQSRLAPFWAAAASGCRLNRDTVGLVRAAGFRTGEVRRHVLGWVVELPAVAPGAAANERAATGDGPAARGGGASSEGAA